MEQLLKITTIPLEYQLKIENSLVWSTKAQLPIWK